MNDQPAGARCSILIVEDEPIVAKDLQQSLREMNYDAYAIASSAEDAIKRATEKCPDLVLMDIRIKGSRDGIQTAEILRRQFGVSVVYLTAHADEATIERASKSAPYGYLLKPIKPAELRGAIEIAIYRQKLDKGLRDRERGFSAALGSISDAVLSVDLAGKITYLNPAAEALIGAKSGEAIGKSAEEVLRQMGHASSGEYATPLDEAMTRKQAVEGEHAVGGPADAARTTIGERATPIMEEGHLLGAVMVFRDASEKARMQKQLELADRLTSLGTMAAGTAHELNNPLAIVVTNAGFAADELQHLRAELKSGATPETKDRRLTRIFEALGDVQAAASRMARIVADLRAFSRPIEESSQTIDARRCIEWAVRATTHEFHHRAQLRTRLSAAPAVSGDAARLEQVLVNLLVNAAHAIPPGKAEQNEVGIALRTDEQGRAVIEVSDTGAGMRPEIMKKIFEPFFTTKTADTGTGLGLSICHGIVKSLGGEIQVASELAKGTTFTIVLPPAQQAQSTPVADGGLPAVARRARILVIDDETALLRAMQRVLEDENHTVTTVDNAADALAMLDRGDRFDVILSDLMMPMMTGVEFYETMLARDPAMAKCIVFVSGGAITAKVDAFLKSVSNLRMEKPFKAAQLREIVQTMLTRSR
jgi:PAS domain S-box-containing protein